jgi:hypothetical protein
LVAGAGKECGVMAAFPKEIAEFMAEYGVTFDEVWKIPQGNAYAIKHKALERVAAKRRILFDAPQVLEANGIGKSVAICVTGYFFSPEHGKSDHREWSIGEASPANNKNAYCYAMAEKRAKDRVILKLLNIHGALYSEDELDERRQNPHVTTPSDVSDAAIEYDQYGQPIDNIPNGDPSIQTLAKKDARKDYEAAQKEMRATVTLKQLETWAARNANRIQSYPADWAEIFRKLYAEHRDSLRAMTEARGAA